MLNRAIINLSVLKANALKIKKKIKKGVKFCAVVKADAYGHGAPIVANTLYPYVDCFAVAILEEAVALRLSGIDKDILILNPIFKSDIEIAVKYNFILSVTDKKQVNAINKEAIMQGKRINVHVKYNTGMNRLGVTGLENLTALLDYINGKKGVNLHGMYSHLSNPQNKNSINNALNKFLLANNLVKGYNINAICHISASGGFLQGVQADMVRIGILLYGYKPFPSKTLSVKPIMKIYAPKLCDRKLHKKETALYGDKKTEKDCSFSLVRYGYADGLERKQIDGQFNNRCMDHTAIINAKTKNGLICVMDDADKLAREYQTISYEILTKSALRAEKIYIK